MSSTTSKLPSTSSSTAAPALKRKKSAFALGLAKLVPTILRKSSGKQAQLVPSSSTSDSLNSLLPKYYTLPHSPPPKLQPLSHETSNTPSKPNSPTPTTSYVFSSPSAQQASPPAIYPFSHPSHNRLTAARTFSSPHGTTTTTAWTSEDGYVHHHSAAARTPSSTPNSKATPSQSTFRRWVSDSAATTTTTLVSRQRVPSNSATLEEAARKVERGRLTLWEDVDVDAGAGEVDDIRRRRGTEESLEVWEVGTKRKVEVEEGKGKGKGEEWEWCERSLRGDVVVDVDESDEEEEDSFPFSHHLAPSLHSSSPSSHSHSPCPSISLASTSFDLSPWTFPPSSSFNTNTTSSSPINNGRRAWVRPSSYEDSPSTYTRSGSPHARLGSEHSSESRYSTELDRRGSSHSSWAASGYARSSGGFGEGSEAGETEDEEEPLTPNVGLVGLPASDTAGKGSLVELEEEEGGGWGAQ